jgi:epoxyqueuosine reductase
MSSALRRLAQRAKAQAYGLGFNLVGIARLGPVRSWPRLEAWINAGLHGEMVYMARGAELRADTTRPEPGMRTAIVVALDYGGREPAGPIARYARGRDYHNVMRARLRDLHRALEAQHGARFAARPYVDSGPVLERDLAQLAGLGWIGKNTMLINPRMGSFFLLGALFTALDLPADEPFEADRCGTCTRCLDACPTQAFPSARVLDATRCISYLTIENRGEIPSALRELMQEHIFGCDVCQDVCPFNEKFATSVAERAFAARAPGEPPWGVEPEPRNVGQSGQQRSSPPHPGTRSPSLIELMAMDENAWDAFSRGSALRRVSRSGFRRNTAIALGNRGNEDAVPLLEDALHDTDPVVRVHAAWALEAVRSASSRSATGRSGGAGAP